MTQPLPYQSGPSALSAPLPEPSPAWTTGHDVQFYDSEDFLYAAVAKFVGEAISAGQPLVLITTEAHRRGFEAQLRTQSGGSIDPAAEITWLDARETLAAFMEGTTPNPELFEATVGNVLDRVMAQRSYLVVRAYGEMVDLLWKDGNVEGAIALEGLWNSLAAKYRFNLLCAYSMANFFKESHAPDFTRICEAHTRVSPTEAYLHGDETDRLKQITLLQQQARALEVEVRHRRELERALRETLAQRRIIEDELRRREAELRDFVENGLEAMHWVDAEGVVIWANQAECQMLGYARDEIVGRHVSNFHADETVLSDILARLSRGEEIRNQAARLRRKDGTTCEVLVSSNVFRQDGKFIHTRCFTRDISTLNLT